MSQHHVKLILKYLKERDCIESLLTLQRETGVSLCTYSKQVDFFRKIMLKGDFAEAVSFILTFQNRIDEKDLRRMVLDVYRQKLYELIEDPDEEQLKRIFQKEIVGYCSEEEFQELFNCLTYRSVSEIQGLERWTPIRGRYQCFEAVVPFLEMFNSVLKEEKEVPSERLESIIDAYYSNQSGKEVKNQPQNISFIKNKTNIQISNLNNNRPSIEEEVERKQPQQQQYEKQKQTIKNSIINMNLSGNYSQIKNKVNTSNLYNNPSKVVEEPQVKQKPSLLQMQKSSSFDRNPSTFTASNVSDRRPRVNASLNGPMNQNQKIDSSVKIDNYLRNDPISDDNIPSPPPQRPAKPLQKSQNFSQISQPPPPNPYPLQNKNSKRQSPQQIYTRQDNPVLLNQLHDLSSSQLNEISQEQRSQTAKSVKLERSIPAPIPPSNASSKPAYIFNAKSEQQQLQEQIKRNIEYLEQTSSVIYKSKEDLEKQNFTFSHQRDSPAIGKVKKVVKLAAITDSKAIRTCQFSQTGNYFAVGTNSSVLKIFDVQRLFQRNKYQEISPLYQIDGLHLKSIFCLDWSANERSLLTCSNDLHIKLTQIGKGFSQHRTTVIGKHDSCIRMVRFGAQEGRVVSCGDDSVIKVWDTGKLKRCTTLKGHTSSIGAIKLQSENEVYSVSKDMTIRRWDLRTAQSIATSKSQDSQLTYIASNTERIIVSHRDGTVSFFSPGLQLQHSVQIHEEEIRSIQALRGEGMLLSASFDGHVALFTQRTSHNPNYFQHNDAGDDKVVFATFLHSTQFRGFASTSTLGLCHLYSYE